MMNGASQKDGWNFACLTLLSTRTTVIVISKFIERRSKSERRAPAYSRALQISCMYRP